MSRCRVGPRSRVRSNGADNALESATAPRAASVWVGVDACGERSLTCPLRTPQNSRALVVDECPVGCKGGGITSRGNATKFGRYAEMDDVHEDFGAALEGYEGFIYVSRALQRNFASRHRVEHRFHSADLDVERPFKEPRSGEAINIVSRHGERTGCRSLTVHPTNRVVSPEQGKRVVAEPVNRKLMPPAKKTTKKTAKKTTKKTAEKTTKRSRERKLSVTHKKALAEGRTNSSIVNNYLSAINAPRKRGRKVSTATLEQRLVAAQTEVKTATGVDKVLAAQEVRDLRATIARASTSNGADVKSLETRFVKIAKTFGENRGVTYGAWRDAGVPADVLRKAGVARTRV